MHATQVLLATVLGASAVFAAPTTVSSRASATSDWVVEDLTRTCTDDQSSCTWVFNIFDGVTTTGCTYLTAGPAAAGGPTVCGEYSVGSSYLGDKNPPYTQMTITRGDLMIWPSYTDDVLANPPVPNWTAAPQPTISA